MADKEQAKEAIADAITKAVDGLSIEDYKEVLGHVLSDCESRLDAAEHDEE